MAFRSPLKIRQSAFAEIAILQITKKPKKSRTFESKSLINKYKLLTKLIKKCIFIRIVKNRTEMIECIIIYTTIGLVNWDSQFGRVVKFFQSGVITNVCVCVSMYNENINKWL